MRCERPSFAPIVVTTSLSGSISTAKLRDAAAGRVAVVPRVVSSLGELLDGDLGRRDVRVAEPEVDDVLAGSPRRCLELIDLGEHIRREPGDAAQFHWWRLHRPPSGLDSGRLAGDKDELE
jgi:hypothetical protein